MFCNTQLTVENCMPQTMATRLNVILDDSSMFSNPIPKPQPSRYSVGKMSNMLHALMRIRPYKGPAGRLISWWPPMACPPWFVSAPVVLASCTTFPPWPQTETSEGSCKIMTHEWATTVSNRSLYKWVAFGDPTCSNMFNFFVHSVPSFWIQNAESEICFEVRKPSSQVLSGRSGCSTMTWTRSVCMLGSNMKVTASVSSCNNRLLWRAEASDK